MLRIVNKITRQRTHAKTKTQNRKKKNVLPNSRFISPRMEHNETQKENHRDSSKAYINNETKWLFVCLMPDAWNTFLLFIILVRLICVGSFAHGHFVNFSFQVLFECVTCTSIYASKLNALFKATSSHHCKQ